MSTSAQSQIDALAKKQGNGAQPQVFNLIRAMNSQIAAALPKHMAGNAERYARIAMTTLRTSKQLMKCSPQSVIAGVMEAAQIGLELDGVLGHAYLVPYKNEAQLQIGYKGFINLAYRGGATGVSAEVVRRGDHFDFRLGTGGYIHHRPALEERGEPIAVWCNCTFPQGEIFRVLTLSDIERAKKSSKTAGRSDSPWQTHWDEMARKTAVRSVLKYAPLSGELTTAVARDEMREAGIATPMVIDVVDAVDPMDQAEGADAS